MRTAEKGSAPMTPCQLNVGPFRQCCCNCKLRLTDYRHCSIHGRRGGVQMTLYDRAGEVSVYLHEQSGDHVVIRYRVDPKGGEYPAVLPHGSEAWEHAVARAMRGNAFL